MFYINYLTCVTGFGAGKQQEGKFFYILNCFKLTVLLASQVSETAIYLRTGSETANGRRVRFLFVFNCFKLIILFVSQVSELANGRRVRDFWFLIVLS